MLAMETTNSKILIQTPRSNQSLPTHASNPPIQPPDLLVMYLVTSGTPLATYPRGLCPQNTAEPSSILASSL